MSTGRQEDPLIVLRHKIIEALGYLEREHEWVTTEMVVKFLEMKFAETHTLSKVGNNLRVLREHRVVEDKVRRGVRQWKLTGTEYAPDIPRKMLVSFPSSVHDRIVEFSKRAEMSKNAFVVNMVITGIKNLSPIRDPFADLTPPDSEDAS